jgi:hypothetical protein
MNVPEELTRAIGQVRAAKAELMRLEQRLAQEPRPSQFTRTAKLAEVEGIRRAIGVELDSLEMLGLIFAHERGG